MYALATSLQSLSGAFSARSTSSTSSLSCGRPESEISTASSEPGMGTRSEFSSAAWSPLASVIVASMAACVRASRRWQAGTRRESTEMREGADAISVLTLTAKKRSMLRTSGPRPFQKRPRVPSPSIPARESRAHVLTCCAREGGRAATGGPRNAQEALIDLRKNSEKQSSSFFITPRQRFSSRA